MTPRRERRLTLALGVLVTAFWAVQQAQQRDLLSGIAWSVVWASCLVLAALVAWRLR